MGVILGNKYQSKSRDNFRKIVGISAANEKIKPENMPRIFGGIGEVYFNGQSAAGQITGNGGGSGSGENPNGGGGGSGGGGNGQCVCENIDEIGSGLIATPCCIYGMSCETGTPIKIQLQPSETPTIPCEQPKPPPKDDPDTIIIKWEKRNGFSTPITYEYELATMDNGAGAANSAIQQSVDSFRSNVSACGAVSNVHCQITSTFSNNGKSFEYCRTMSFNTENCSVNSVSVDIMRATTAGDSYYNAGLENWNKKNQQKQYFVKNGKFYNACDPYGEPPSEEPITICDTDGNQYSVSPDGKITPITD